MKRQKLEHFANYIRAERGRHTTLAKFLGVSDSYLSQMVSGLRPIRPAFCVLIVQFCGGTVSRQQLRPNDYWLIWPDLPTPDGMEPSHA